MQVLGLLYSVNFADLTLNGEKISLPKLKNKLVRFKGDVDVTLTGYFGLYPTTLKAEFTTK